MSFMKYEIIFYHSGKTAEIERTAAHRLEKIGLELSASAAAVNPEELAAELDKALKKTNIVFVVGGLDGGVQSTENVLSAVLSSNGSTMKSNKLVDDDENTVYLLKCRKQTIAVFPDDTDVIGKMLDAKIVSELKKTYSLKEEKNDVPSIEKIANDLNTNLAGISRVRTSINIGGEPPKNTEGKKTLKTLKTAVIVLLSVGAVQFAAALYLFITNL